jgi:protein-S-isoprenylcysteine O-methyltransferase Ste14
LKFKKSYRVPLGFLAGALFLWRADPDISTYFWGAALIIFGEIIRFVSSGTLKKFEGVTRNGIYAYTRNPLYIGSFIIGLGACLMGRDPLFTTAFLILYVYLYARVILNEEKWLINKYGDDYVHYLSEAPRLIPRKFDIAFVLSQTSPARAIKNKEGKTLLGIAAIYLALAAKMIWQ